LADFPLAPVLGDGGGDHWTRSLRSSCPAGCLRQSTSFACGESMFLVDIKPDVEFIFHCGVFDCSWIQRFIQNDSGIIPVRSCGQVLTGSPSGSRRANTPHLFQDRVRCSSTSPQP
jgi:hypothetical protein